MTDPSLALQTALRGVLISSASLVALVPAANIYDRSARPERFPCVILGDGHTALREITLSRSHVDATLDLHVWTHEQDLASVKIIAGAVNDALRGAVLNPADHRVIDFKINSTRFIRDPGLEHSHAVINIEALLELTS